MPELTYVILSPIDDKETTITIEDAHLPPVGSEVELNHYELKGSFIVSKVSVRVTKMTERNTSRQVTWVHLEST